MAGNLIKQSDFPAKQAATDAIMGIGGEIQIADGEVTIAMTPSVHSSSVFNPEGGSDLGDWEVYRARSLRGGLGFSEQRMHRR